MTLSALACDFEIGLDFQFAKDVLQFSKEMKINMIVYYLKSVKRNEEILHINFLKLLEKRRGNINIKMGQKPETILTEQEINEIVQESYFVKRERQMKNQKFLEEKEKEMKKLCEAEKSPKQEVKDEELTEPKDEPVKCESEERIDISPNKFEKKVTEVLYGLTVVGKQSEKYYPHQNDEGMLIKTKSILGTLVRNLWSKIIRKEGKNEMNFDWKDIDDDPSCYYEDKLRGNDLILERIKRNGLNGWTAKSKRLCSRAQRTRNLIFSSVPLEIPMDASRLEKLWEKMTNNQKGLLNEEVESQSKKMLNVILLTMADKFIKNLKKKKKYKTQRVEEKFTEVLLKKNGILASSWEDTDTFRAAKGR
jgi:hypothetical protein